MSERSNRVANYLRALGVGRGDRLLVMLSNVVPLWEITLAAIKLGAVLSPATTLLSSADLADRIERGQMRGVVADTGCAAKFDGIADDCIRLLTDGQRPVLVGAISRGGIDEVLARHLAHRPQHARVGDPARRDLLAHHPFAGRLVSGHVHASPAGGASPSRIASKSGKCQPGSDPRSSWLVRSRSRGVTDT